MPLALLTGALALVAGAVLGAVICYPIAHAMGHRRAQWDAIAVRTRADRERQRERNALTTITKA